MTIFVNSRPVDSFLFSGGECHVRLPSVSRRAVTVYAQLTNSDAIMELLLVADALKRQTPGVDIDLTIPYFPYARQDRVCNPGEAFSLKVMARLINSLGCKTVTIYDPHSDVTSALIDRCVVKSLVDLIKPTQLVDFIVTNQLTIVSPDAGAEKKVHAVAQFIYDLYPAIDIVHASKIRNTADGKIISTQVAGQIKYQDYLILDDICDGGKTFIELAKKLKKLGARNIYLYVSHGIFSKGFDELRKYFSHLFCYQTVNCTVPVDINFLTLLEETNHEY